ncbi:response regulator transcription factor [Paenibacillus sp. J5C_2022]|uniref:response regulator transcription factor n=1 Tax=Paenibacillus sp. J5C2022 TaxID=2977129 RepID=UPI0021D16B62|nr:response regulator transcription factor [Paenibacillus sp. J5C2022]MCU6708688.1 response regulator transcription factor [Paenibacillus sp. J5C2022]
MTTTDHSLEQHHILIVEDDADIAELIAIYLHNAGFHTSTAGTLKEADRLLEKLQPQLVLCDIMLPDGEGTDWVQSVRRQSSALPVIFLSSRKEPKDIIAGLELGGDDYMTKPFDPDVMVARVKAQLRRSASAGGDGHAKTDKERQWTDGRLELHFGRREIRVNGEELRLPAKELQLLFLLAEHPDQVFNVEQLYESVWGMDGWSDQRTVMVHIHNVRRKIEEDVSLPRYILTVRGVGYKFRGGR